MDILFKNIKELIQVREESIQFLSGKEMSILPTLKNAFLLVENGLISAFGNMDACPDLEIQTIDATDRMLLPSWCDSHTHLVYAGNREDEFVDRINGFTYKEIADNGGGILNSAKRLQETSEEDLYNQSKLRLEEIIQLGTGAVEIKSGYGLTKEAELKMLRVIKKLKEKYPVQIKATFLGAHAVPLAYKDDKSAYLQMLITEVLPSIQKENLADFIDIFCETGYFSAEDTQQILVAGKKHGLVGKIHVNQFTAIGGIQIGVANKALSVDHLETLRIEDIEALKNTKTMPVALPSCSYFLSIPYAPARKIIDAGLPIALATDYNPGSTPSGNMNFVVATACIKMKMTPEEAMNAATINGAYAMNLQHSVGSITKGKLANLILTKKINSYNFIPYSFGNHCIEKVFLKGVEIKKIIGMHFFNDLQVDYKAGNKEEYSGRASIINNEYWHQIIKVAHIKDLGLGNTEIGIIGYVCDEGVKRNQGRVGAKQGPASLRNTLGKLPIHFNTKEIVDFGNVICSGNYLEDCQKAFSRTISKLIKNKILPIGIGGGHDIAYAHFNGIKDALKLTPKNKIGIINFDAHFDLRPVEDSPNSGTPFYQILKEHTNSSYFAIGIQQQANTKTLFEIAAKNKVTYVSNLDCETFTERLKEKLKSFIEKVDYLYVTIDLDGFSSAYAPGVSAPSPAGFTPHFVFKVLENIFQSKKVISCDIAELNPTYDIDNHTATLAARLVDFMVSKA